MGLDIYALHGSEEHLTEEETSSFAEAGINLCGGMMSGNGNNGSFRGKVYAEAVEEITSESLYEEWLPPETVATMTQALMERFDELVALMWVEEDAPSERQQEEAESLVRFFQVCRKHGLGLHGWW